MLFSRFWCCRVEGLNSLLRGRVPAESPASLPPLTRLPAGFSCKGATDFAGGQQRAPVVSEGRQADQPASSSPRLGSCAAWGGIWKPCAQRLRAGVVRSPCLPPLPAPCARRGEQRRGSSAATPVPDRGENRSPAAAAIKFSAAAAEFAGRSRLQARERWWWWGEAGGERNAQSRRIDGMWRRSQS